MIWVLALGKFYHEEGWCSWCAFNGGVVHQVYVHNGDDTDGYAGVFFRFTFIELF